MNLPLSKYFYFIVFLGTVSYFMLHTFTSVKLPVIKITFEPSNERGVKQYSVRNPVANVHHKIEETLAQHEEKNKIFFKERNSITANTISVKTKPAKYHKIKLDNTQKLSARKEKTMNDILTFLESFKQVLMAENEDDKDAMKAIKGNSTAKQKERRSSLSQLLEQQKIFLKRQNFSSENPCPDDHKKAGLLVVDKEPISMKELEQSFLDVHKGGFWFPTKCKANKKVAVVVPFRDRQTHLNIFLHHMHQLLKLHLLSYRIFVVEQASQTAFNRGMLMNIGFVEAKRTASYDCVIFHDVDLIPEDDRNDYSCLSSPRHMSTAVDTMKYKLQYKKLFGGVEGFWTEHYEKINGFPNRYWGWGGEDDDLYVRITEKRLHLTRPAIKIGRYTMLRHTHKRTDSNPNRYYELRRSRNMITRDGLSNLHYKVTSRVELALYTLISVDIRPTNR